VQLLQDKLMKKHLSSQMALNFNTLFLFFSSGFFFKTLIWHTHDHLIFSKKSQNEEDMVVKSKRGQCLVIGLIHI
jgi:hypothetical protein